MLFRSGEERTLNVTFPDDYQAEALKGKAAVFKVKVNNVQTAVLPELNDEFITAFGVTEGGVEKFHSDVRKNMERELKQGIKNNIKTQVLDGLVTTHNIEVPKAMVANEIQRLRENMMRQFGGNAKNINPSMLPDELFTEQGKRAAALGLLVGEIIKSTAMKVDGDRVKALIEEIAESYETPADVLNWYYGNKEQMQQIESVVLEDQVIDHVLSQAQIADKACGYEDVLRPQQG